MERSEEDKVRFLNEHVCYEVEELLNCRSFFGSLVKHQASIDGNLFVVFQNTALEHTLLHSRNLLEFFFYGAVKGHAQASDYVNGWQKIRGDWTDNLQKLEQRVNNEIAHLDWRRLNVKPEERSWNLVPLVDDLLDTAVLFFSKLDDSYMGERAHNLQAALEFYRTNKTIILDFFATLLKR